MKNKASKMCFLLQLILSVRPDHGNRYGIKCLCYGITENVNVQHQTLGFKMANCA